MEGNEEKRPRAFRVGLMRRVGTGFAFKAAAKIGLASDGGVFVTPYGNTDSWSYGIVSEHAPLQGEHLVTTLTPKLHYHRSGIVSATPPTGQDMERRRLQLTPLPDLHRAQILSIASVRTWDLPTRPKGILKGDQGTAILRWPDVAIWTVSVLDATEDQRHALQIPELPSMGLLTGETFTHSVISLAAYGRQAVLILTVETEYNWDYLPAVGGTSVVALPTQADNPPDTVVGFALWSSGQRNPLVKWAESPPATLRPVSTFSSKTWEDSFDELAETTLPLGGLGVRRTRPQPPNSSI